MAGLVEIKAPSMEAGVAVGRSRQNGEGRLWAEFQARLCKPVLLTHVWGEGWEGLGSL